MEGNTNGHSKREFRKVGVHSSGRVHPEQTIVVCEASGCKREVLISDSYSFVIAMATTGPAPRPSAYQCGDEQHFCCSPKCAKKAANECIDHLLAELEVRRGAK